MEKMTYTVKEAAELLGVSKSFMYKMIQNNEIPVLKLGKRIIIPKTKFQQFINQ